MTMTKPNADDEAREIVGAFTLELGPTRRPPKATEEMLMQVIAAALTRSRQRVVEVVKAKRDEWQRQADIYADDGPRDNQPQELLPCPFCGERPVLDDAGDVLCKKTKCLVHPFVIQSVRDGKPLNDPVMAWNARAACPDEVEAPDDEIVKIRHAYGGTKPAWFSEPHAFAQVATDMDRVTSTVAALRERIVALQEEREKEM